MSFICETTLSSRDNYKYLFALFGCHISIMKLINVNYDMIIWDQINNKWCHKGVDVWWKEETTKYAY
jgi:hypothetical protein